MNTITIQKINSTFQSLANMTRFPHWTTILSPPQLITSTRNDLILISQNIASEYPHFSAELFRLKDDLFIGYGTVHPHIHGQIIAILRALQFDINNQTNTGWNIVHPKIQAVAKQLYLDKHFSNAALSAFIEINNHVKNIYLSLEPSADKVPDGDGLMTKMFSPNRPLLRICDTSNESGENEQRGFMMMLQGAMAALRNPKAHANIIITGDDAMRQITFASMLMYKIDAAVIYSKIKE